MNKQENFDGYLRKPVLKVDLYKQLSVFLAYETERVEKENIKKFQLSLKAKANLSNITHRLTHDIEELYNQAKKSNKMGDTKILVKALMSLSHEYDIEPLEYYATQLSTAIEAFNITKIEELLHSYKKIQEDLST